MTVRDRLSLYKQKAPEKAKESAHPAIPGGTRVGGDGGLWKFSNSTPLAEIAPLCGLDADAPWDLSPFLRHHRLPPELGLEDLLFVDLETTGLSMGTGTYAFLVGLAFVRGGVFTVEQYFMGDFADEPAMLEAILPRFAGATLVTFNGRAFDIPLIKSRYRMNRVPGYPVDAPHIDLLQPSRKIFRRVFESCALKNLEERLLGIYREDDIPGWMVPDVYFSYQREGEIARVPAVIEHNRQDIASMLVLLMVITAIYRELDAKRYDGMHRQSLANIAHHLYRRDLEAFIDVARFLGEEVRTDRALFKKFSAALKRTGRLGEALEFWAHDGSVFSLEELARHAEHRERDYATALRRCEEAMALLARGVFSEGGEPIDTAYCDFLRERLTHRIERIRRKSSTGGNKK